MHTLDLQHPSWYRALTLAERLASLREGRQSPRDSAIDAGRAERHLRRWRDQHSFSKDGHFARRLAADGMEEDDLRRLLGEPIEAVRDRSLVPPDWLVKLDQAFSRLDPAPAAPPEEANGHPLAGFLEIIMPLIGQGRDRLREGIEVLGRERGSLPFDRRTIERALHENLAERLIHMVSGTMALELHVARLQGDLPGDTAEERFQSFLERMRVPEHAVGLLQDYPVLARQVVEWIDQWTTFSLEFVRHLCTDLEAIRDSFCPEGNPGTLTGVAGGVSDTHHGGRSVLIAEFSSGLRVVYKPRNLAVDVHFQALLSWLNERGDHPPFRTLKVLDRKTYGWVEFVTQESCTSSGEVRRFYRRQGGYLALLHALEATDFHYENLIAAGEHPVLIDLEALFHPRETPDVDAPASELVDDAMAHSVLRVGLLPQRFWADQQSEGVDVSGLGAVAGQLTPQQVPCWENAGTDALRQARKRVTIPGGRHRPSLNGEATSALDEYSKEIEAGFTEVYRLLWQFRDSLLSAAGVLGPFEEDEVRVILRSTRSYATMLRESFHPDLLRDALDRDRFFDHLWVEATKRPGLVAAIPAEREDLLRGDIPALKSRPGSRALWGSDGERIACPYQEPAMAAVRRRLRQMSDEDLTRQLWVIRASLATLSRTEARTARPGPRPVRPDTEVGGHGFLAAARAIGDRLASVALRSEREAAWIGLVAPPDERYWSLMPLGLDLYDGHPGVLLFLAHLGASTGEERYTVLAQSALAWLRRMIERGRSTFNTIGYTNGWGGIIYTYSHLYALWKRPELLTEADELVGQLPPLIDQDDHLDLTRGSAGCIGGLISLYRCSPSARTLEAAVQCGDRLLSQSRTMERGIAWASRVPSLKPLTGFAHGTAGIAWALGELADLTGEARFRTAEREAVAYERSLFSPESKNWPDLRDHGALGLARHNDQAHFIAAWCHGAPGIGLARLLSLRRLNESETRVEIEAALETTLAHGFGDNHSLCHGDLGNLETLLQAAQRLANPRWSAESGRIAAATLESIREHGWICGVPSGVEAPGLMTGLAGIGYGLLRLAEPSRTPSVLAIEPPKCPPGGA